jgi:beta-galactosidase
VAKNIPLLALGLFCTAVLNVSSPILAKPASVAPHASRQTTDLSGGWRFHFGDAPEAVTSASFDDSAWEKVSVPHTWNRIGEYSLTRSAETNNKQGVGYYRLNYAAPPSVKGRRQYLDFAAVAIIADVWVNGVHVGQHKGGYSRFRFDVSAVWKSGAANLIVVRADNSKPAAGSSTEHVMPLAGDFFQYGGIYRGVQLIEANAFSFDLLDHGGSALYISTPAVDARQATVSARMQIRNRDTRLHNADVRLSIRDSNGATVAETKVTTSKLGWRSGLTDDGEITLAIPEPQLWDGVNAPTLYRATAQLIEKGSVVDEVTQTFGIRSFKFDANSGFTLNGKSLKLKGVSRHQDRLGKGYALTAADHAEDMAIIKDIGANSIRQAHYQHADEWSDEADKAGMIVWAEVPFVTTPSFTGGEGSAELFANAEQQARELIRQNYNHPSIVMWSVGNEVDAATMFGASKEPVKPLRLLQYIAKIAREEDPGRPTVFADCCEDVSISSMSGQADISATNQLAGTTDLVGYNRYYGWYYPQPLKAAAQLAAQMDKFHVKHPALPISISEYGAGGAVSQHSDNVLTGFVNAIGRPQPEEFESWVHEQSWPVIRDRPFIFGSYVWNMFDFASDLRNEGDSVDINTKGLVTMDRKVKKDAFYYYQAQWSDKPMIHITGSRYVDRAYAQMDVRTYSNAPSASLTVNGTNIGEAPCPDHICLWRNVAIKPGPNTVISSAVSGSQRISDTATWNGPDAAAGIHLDAGDKAGRLLGTRRFGSDTFVTGGTPAVLNMGGFGGRRAGPPKAVAAADPALYDYWREGEAFSYAIPVPNGRWNVTVHTFEPRMTDTSKVMMRITAQGKPSSPIFNVSTAAGGALKGIARTFPVTVKDGVLKLDFAATGGKAVVAAIEVTK